MKLALFGNKIVADFWNKNVLGTLKKEEASSGAHIRVEKFPQGQLVSVKDSGMWHHPWFTSPAWNPDAGSSGRWECTVTPGFVDGVDPRVPAAEAEEAARLEAQKKGSGKGVTLGLCDQPKVPFHQYKTLTDQIPKFFQVLGVKAKKEKVTINAAAEKITWDITSAQDTGPKERWLQQAQVYISKARATYKMETTIQGDFITGQIVDYTVGFDMYSLEKQGTRARIYTAGEMPPTYRANLVDRLAGVYGDDGEDRHVVATVFFLSPADFKPPDDPKATMPPPDEKWTPYVRHTLFWNLCCKAKNLPPVNVKQSPKDPFLAWYVGRYTVAPMATLGAMDAEYQRLLTAAMNSSTNEGHFWTI